MYLDAALGPRSGLLFLEDHRDIVCVREILRVWNLDQGGRPTSDSCCRQNSQTLGRSPLVLVELLSTAVPHALEVVLSVRPFQDGKDLRRLEDTVPKVMMREGAIVSD